MLLSKLLASHFLSHTPNLDPYRLDSILEANLRPVPSSRPTICIFAKKLPPHPGSEGEAKWLQQQPTFAILLSNSLPSCLMPHKQRAKGFAFVIRDPSCEQGRRSVAKKSTNLDPLPRSFVAMLQPMSVHLSPFFC